MTSDTVRRAIEHLNACDALLAGEPTSSGLESAGRASNAHACEILSPWHQEAEAEYRAAGAALEALGRDCLLWADALVAVETCRTQAVSSETDLALPHLRNAVRHALNHAVRRAYALRNRLAALDGPEGGAS